MATENSRALQPEAQPSNAPRVRQSDQVSLSFVALVETTDEKLPSILKLRDHSLQFNECEHFPKTVITGTHGLTSKQELVVIAGAWSKGKKGRLPLTIDTQYRVDNLKEANRNHATWEAVTQTGWLQIDRLSAQLRDEIKSEWLGWIEEDLGSRRAARMAELTLGEIALEHPRYVARMLRKTSPRLTVIIHPVHPKLDPEKVLSVATVRLDKDRFVGPAVRFMSNIEVAV